MKRQLILLLFFVSAIGWAQDINQFDADGNRHGVWKKNFDGTQQPRY